MSKDITRDYTTAMFRFYALMNEPNREKIEDLKNKVSNAEYEDLLAVECTMQKLEQENKHDIIGIVEYVYFRNPKAELHKGEIQSRLTAFSCDNYIDERTAWRWLKTARIICANYRGLRVAN